MYRPWTARTVGRRWAWHDITALGQHTRSNDVGRGTTSPPLDSTHYRTTLGVTCHYRLWTAHTFNNVGRGLKSPPLDSTHDRTTPGVPYHHYPLIAPTIERRRVWHGITALGQHTRSDDVGRGMISPHLDNTHSRQRQAWHDITSLGQPARSPMSGVA